MNRPSHIATTLLALLAGALPPGLARGSETPPAAVGAAVEVAASDDGPGSAKKHEAPKTPSPAAEDAAEHEVVTRESEQLSDTLEDWTGSGFRLRLSVGYAHIRGGASSPAMNAVDTSVSVGWRFTERWGVMATFRYGALFEGFEGLRWATTIEPLYFITSGLMVSAGVGLGGLLGARTASNSDYPSTFDYSVYANDPDKIMLSGQTVRPNPPPFPACDGDAFVTVVRVAYLFMVGDLFSTGPVLQADGQWTVCQDHGFDPHLSVETRRLAPRQLWGHYAIGVAWSAAWR